MFEEQLGIIDLLASIGGEKAKQAAMEKRSELLKKALADLYEYSTASLRFLNDGFEPDPQERDNVKSVIIQSLMSSGTIASLKYIFFKKKDTKAYDDYIETCHDKTIEFYYDNYFSKRIVVKNGRLYSLILDKFWDPQSECWVGNYKGHETYYFSFPYKGEAISVGA